MRSLRHHFRFNKYYFSLSLLLFATEIIIAKFAHDKLVRPYGGDYLVVVLLYCLLRSFINISVVQAAISVLLFSYSVEYLQFLKLADKLELVHGGLVRMLLGDYFNLDRYPFLYAGYNNHSSRRKIKAEVLRPHWRRMILICPNQSVKYLSEHS
jgi:hypothetical protein